MRILWASKEFEPPNSCSSSALSSPSPSQPPHQKSLQASEAKTLRYAPCKKGSLQKYLNVVTERVRMHALHLEYQADLVALGVPVGGGHGPGGANLLGETGHGLFSKVLKSMKEVENKFEAGVATAAGEEEKGGGTEPYPQELLPGIAQVLMKLTKETRELRKGLGYDSDDEEGRPAYDPEMSLHY